MMKKRLHNLSIDKLDIVKTKNKNKNDKNERFFSGLTGENIALNELIDKGFSLVRKRYRSECGEIDLIVEDPKQKLIVFVEVKRRKAIYDYSSVISSKQWERIYQSSLLFLSENKKYLNYNIRYDAFICFTDSKTTLHIENISIS